MNSMFNIYKQSIAVQLPVTLILPQGAVIRQDININSYLHSVSNQSNITE